MPHPIDEFLQARFETRWKAETKKEAPRDESEVQSEFRTDVWIESAAARAGQLSMVSHPGKFSHPDAKVTPVLFEGQAQDNGYLHSGNIKATDDVLGNAAALDVYGFLSIRLEDGRTVLQHFESESPTLRTWLDVDDETFARWRSGLLKIKEPSGQSHSDYRVKQVYFPVADGYHLLSVLTPSGMLTENRARLQAMTFGDAAKEAKEARKKSNASETGFDDITGVLTVKYGGSNAQNISKLNAVNGGVGMLLPSLPPSLDPDRVRRPRRDFFQELRRDRDLEWIITSLHRLFQTDYTNVNIRNARKKWFESLFGWAFQRSMTLQSLPAGWSDVEGIELPHVQKIWLDEAHFDGRDDDLEWREKIADSLASWCVVTYRKYRRRSKDTADLGAVDVAVFSSEAIEYARVQQEDLL